MTEEKDRKDYIMQWEKENYDRILLRLPKGYKKILKEHIGKTSMNSYLKALIDKDLDL